MAQYTIGLDIGGTKIAAGTVDQRGHIVKKINIPTEVRRGKKIILKNILTATSKVWLPEVKAIGVGMAGHCNFKTGIFVSGPNFPKNFQNINIKKFLQKNFCIPVVLDNDARCFTIAENKYGAGRGYKNVIGITFGTGIGSGIILNGQIIRGKNNTAGEIGHATLDASSPIRCSCGRFGHFEALASGAALGRRYEKLTGKFIDAIEFEKKYLKKDQAVQKIFIETTKYLCLGLSNLIYFFNPDIIVIGGGLSYFSALWKNTLHKLKKELIYKSLQKTKIVKTKLGSDAGIIGAALIAKSQIPNPKSKKIPITKKQISKILNFEI